MGVQFLRKVIVDIFPRNGNGISIGNSGSPREIRIDFHIKKTNESHPNQSKIELYNLSQSTRGYLNAKDTIVRVSFGYLGLGTGNNIGPNSDVAQAIIGNITKVKHDKKKKKDMFPVKSKLENTDLITTVEIGDGDNQYRNATLDKGYPPGTQLTTVITDLNTAMGLPKGPQLDIPNKVFANGLTLTGPCYNHLDLLTNSTNLEWSIQDQALQIISRAGMTNDSIVLVSAATGMIGTPNPTTFGVEFEMLANAHLRPGRGCQVKSFESPQLNGVYKVRNVIHMGSNWEGKFESKCEATVAKTSNG